MSFTHPNSKNYKSNPWPFGVECIVKFRSDNKPIKGTFKKMSTRKGIDSAMFLSSNGQGSRVSYLPRYGMRYGEVSSVKIIDHEGHKPWSFVVIEQ